MNDDIPRSRNLPAAARNDRFHSPARCVSGRWAMAGIGATWPFGSGLAKVGNSPPVQTFFPNE
jgi:hypothetical protein